MKGAAEKDGSVMVGGVVGGYVGGDDLSADAETMVLTAEMLGSLGGRPLAGVNAECNGVGGGVGAGGGAGVRVGVGAGAGAVSSGLGVEVAAEVAAAAGRARRLLKRRELEGLPMAKKLYRRGEVEGLLTVDAALEKAQAEWEMRTVLHRQQLESQTQQVSELGFFAGMNCVRDVINVIVGEKQRYLEDIEPDILRLACSIAERIIGEELVQDRSTSEKILRNVLRQLNGDCTHLQIRCSSEDLASLQGQLEVLRREFALDSIRLQEDPSLSRGNFSIVANHQLITAKVEEQLNTLMRELLGGRCEGEGDCSSMVNIGEGLENGGPKVKEEMP